MSNFNQDDTVIARVLADLITGDSSRLVGEILRPVPNFWDIVDYGASAGETRYSKMVGWLLDPQEDHGLGTFFASRFVQTALGEGAPEISERARVHPREWRNIDVLLVDYDEEGMPVRTLVIENKTDTSEHTRSGLLTAQTTWYNWVIRGDFESMEQSVASADLEPAQAARLRKQIRRWKTDTGDYRSIDDAGRHFVYLTPRQDEHAEDPEFRTVTYEQLEGLLDEVIQLLTDRGDTDAAKIVLDFRRTIHRRFDRRLGEQITHAFDEYPDLGAELASVAQQMGVVNAEDTRSGDKQYFTAARTKKIDPEELRVHLDQELGRPITEIELRRLVAHVWQSRPSSFANDTSKFHWGDKRNGRFSKTEMLQKIAQAFVVEHGITSIGEFEEKFGAVVGTVILPDPANPYDGTALLYDPDHHPYSASDAKRYKRTEIDMRERIGAITFDDGRRYRVHWNLGHRRPGRVGVIAHLPVIRHFQQTGDPQVYPIADAS